MSSSFHEVDFWTISNVTTALLVASSFSLIGTVISPIARLIRDILLFPGKMQLIEQEVAAMRGVADECYRTIDQGPVKVSPHVQELLSTTYEQGRQVEDIVRRALAALRGCPDLMRSRFRIMMFLVKDERDLVSAVAVLRDKIGLLRDACSEIRLRGQLIELSAAMARLTELSMQAAQASQGPHTENSAAPVGSLIPLDHQNQIIKVVQDIFKRDLASWEADDYVINGTVQVDKPENKAMVLVEDSAKSGGQRFDYRPARVKVDTGSAADFITLKYLTRVGIKISNLTPIPEANQVAVEGLNGTIYKPEYQINLAWYRQAEAQMNTTQFLVVDNGPFDLLLSSRRFAEEAERRLFSLPLVRPRKTREQIETELKEFERKRLEAKDLEAAQLRMALALRNQQPGRAATIPIEDEGIAPLPNDLEKGAPSNSIAPLSTNSQGTQATSAAPSAATSRFWGRLFWRRSSR